MKIYQNTITIISKKEKEFINITDKVKEIVKKSEVKDGICFIFNPSSTSSIILNEDERMLIQDFKEKISELVEDEKLYHHPSNAKSHIRSTLFGPEKTVPIFESELKLGTWQEIFFVEFDVRERKREIMVTIIGE